MDAVPSKSRPAKPTWPGWPTSWPSCKADAQGRPHAQRSEAIAAQEAAKTRSTSLKAKLNAAASNREYQALKDQIAADQMAGSVLADEILEALEKIDELAAVSRRAAAEDRPAEGRTGQSPASRARPGRACSTPTSSGSRPSCEGRSRPARRLSRRTISAWSTRSRKTPWPRCKASSAAAATSSSRPTTWPS